MERHKHNYQAKRPNPTVLVCSCGRFQHVIKDDTEIIVEQRNDRPCQVCDGTGGTGIEGTKNPKLTPRVCPSCHGTGKRNPESIDVAI